MKLSMTMVLLSLFILQGCGDSPNDTSSSPAGATTDNPNTPSDNFTCNAISVPLPTGIDLAKTRVKLKNVKFSDKIYDARFSATGAEQEAMAFIGPVFLNMHLLPFTGISFYDPQDLGFFGTGTNFFGRFNFSGERTGTDLDLTYKFSWTDKDSDDLEINRSIIRRNASAITGIQITYPEKKAMNFPDGRPYNLLTHVNHTVCVSSAELDQ